MNEILEGRTFFEDGLIPLCVFRLPYTDSSRQKHSHDFYEIMIVTSGMAIHHFEGKDETISMGDIFILQPRMEHAYDASGSGGIEIINLLFSKELLDHGLRDLYDLPNFKALFYGLKGKSTEPRLKLPAKELAHVTRIVEDIERDQEEANPGWECYSETKFRELVVYLTRRYSNILGRHGKDSVQLLTAINYIEKNLNKPIRFEDLSQASEMAPNSLRCAFQQGLGCSPMQYLQKLRIDKAILLLNDYNQSITDVAFKVGYTDSGYFTRIFKKEMGMTPTEFRNGLT